MDSEGLKDLLRKRLYIELQLFKDSMLRRDKEEIYGASYKIEVYANLYEILLEDAESLDGDTVRGLLHWDSGIIESLYQEWLTRDDCIMDELKAYAGSELEVAAQAGRQAYGKEEKDGTGTDKAPEG